MTKNTEQAPSSTNLGFTRDWHYWVRESAMADARETPAFAKASAGSSG